MIRVCVMLYERDMFICIMIRTTPLIQYRCQDKRVYIWCILYYKDFYPPHDKYFSLIITIITKYCIDNKEMSTGHELIYK